jgi:hypothetical protein
MFTLYSSYRLEPIIEAAVERSKKEKQHDTSQLSKRRPPAIT